MRPHQLNPLQYYWCHNEISFPWCHCLRENIIFCQFTIFVDFMDIVKTHIFFFIICSFEWFVISRCHGYLRVCSFCRTHGPFVASLMSTCITTTNTVKKMFFLRIQKNLLLWLVYKERNLIPGLLWIIVQICYMFFLICHGISILLNIHVLVGGKCKFSVTQIVEASDQCVTPITPCSSYFTQEPESKTNHH